MWRWIMVGAILLPCSAIAQDDNISWLYDGLANYEIPGCDDRGCERQVVEPTDAVREYGRHPDAHQWLARLGGDGRYRQDADDSETCSGAVKALFKVVCDERRNCSIEEEYESKCLSSQPDEETEQACVKVVDDYVNRCFGGYYEADARIIGSYLTNDGEHEAFCSGARIELDSNGGPRPIIVTVDHCNDDVEEDTTKAVGAPTGSNAVMIVSALINSWELSEFNSELKLYHLNGGQRFPSSYMEPMLFAETVFMGFNSLIDMRNKVLERARDGVGGTRYSSPLTYDSSPLCTIVYSDPRKIQHTCQSSMGGSGGALYQWVRDQQKNIVEEGIVAVNEGATRSGQVSENRGLPLLRLN